MSTLIRGGTVVTADQTYRADVHVADGVIKAIGYKPDVPAGTKTLDAGDLGGAVWCATAAAGGCAEARNAEQPGVAR